LLGRGQQSSALVLNRCLAHVLLVAICYSRSAICHLSFVICHALRLAIREAPELIEPFVARVRIIILSRSRLRFGLDKRGVHAGFAGLIAGSGTVDAGTSSKR